MGNKDMWLSRTAVIDNFARKGVTTLFKGARDGGSLYIAASTGTLQGLPGAEPQGLSQ